MGDDSNGFEKTKYSCPWYEYTTTLSGPALGCWKTDKCCFTQGVPSSELFVKHRSFRSDFSQDVKRHRLIISQAPNPLRMGVRRKFIKA